jgi:hypothetical protein
MKKYFKVAQFVCACILFLCSGIGFALNIIDIKNHLDGIIILFIGVFIMFMCYLLVREAHKELKQ